MANRIFGRPPSLSMGNEERLYRFDTSVAIDKTSAVLYDASGRSHRGSVAMRILIDVPSGLFDRVQRAVEAGGFASVGQFATLAIENQLSLEAPTGREEGPSLAAGDRESMRSRSVFAHQPSENTSFSDLGVLHGEPVATLDLSAAASMRVADHGWLWGIVNRVFPIKIALRSLLRESAMGPTDLEAAKNLASVRAEAAGRWIATRYGVARPPGDESLLTGLPSREPLFRARERFGDHYFGRVDRKGRASGALFELGLAGVAEKNRVGLTAGGLTFAKLPNPALDAGDLSTALSADEIRMVSR